MENLNPNITGYATFVLLGLAWALRLAFRTFWKDKVEVNASAGINDAVTVIGRFRHYLETRKTSKRSGILYTTRYKN